MDAPEETQQVFHPSSIPVDRAQKQREARQGSYRLCFYTSLTIFALFGGLVFIGTGYLAATLLNKFLFPTKALAIQPKHVQRFNTSQVHPLVDASSTFDIHATVWQDVSDFLARGQHLPEGVEPWKLVEYEIAHRSEGGFAENTTRTEAILFSGAIARGVTLRSKIHRTVPLRIPVAPLYTDNLGRSSLRATFSIVIPEDQAQTLGDYRNVSSVLSQDFPILPRRPDFAERSPSQDLNSALADAGISISLLELVPSPYFRTTSEGKKAHENFASSGTVNPFFSAHRENLHFLEPTFNDTRRPRDDYLPEYRDESARILLPHFRTRSRLGIARMTDVFDNSTFHWRHRNAQMLTKQACKNTVDRPCSRNYDALPFQTVLSFNHRPDPPSVSEDRSDQVSFYYAPILSQVVSPGSPIFQRRIPQQMPKRDDVNETAIFRSNASLSCEIPPARLDSSRQYFEFPWEIYFSAHTLQRGMITETGFGLLQRPDPAPLGPGEEGEKQLIANSVTGLTNVMYLDRFITGDRYHEKDHPSLLVFVALLFSFWHSIVDEVLLFFFWYTRKTSTGLWIEAQFLWIGLQVLSFTSKLMLPFISKSPNPWPSLSEFVFEITALFHLPFMIATLLHLERPAGYGNKVWWCRNPLAFRRRRLTRRERKSIALAELIDKKPFYMLFTGFFLLRFISAHGFFLLGAPRVCPVDDGAHRAFVPLFEKVIQNSTAALRSALLNVHGLAQAWFNRKSRTFTEAFRIMMIGTAVVNSIQELIDVAEFLAHRHDERHALQLSPTHFVTLVAPIWLAYQALTYKGVPQIEPIDDDDDD